MIGGRYSTATSPSIPQRLDRAATTRSFSQPSQPQILHPRSRCQVRLRSICRREIGWPGFGSNLIQKSVAEWRGRTLGRKLPAGSIGSCHCPQCAPFETAFVRIRPLLPRGPNPSWTRQGHTKSKSWSTAEIRIEDTVAFQARRSAPSLRSRSLRPSLS